MADHPGPLDDHPSEIDGSDLFRRRALEAATSRYGAPIRPIGLGGWALTLFMVALLASVMIFLVLGRYTRKETVTGVIQPAAGAARVIALNAGLITDVFVSEGQLVKKGDPILQLSADPTVRGENANSNPVSLSQLVDEGATREIRALSEQAAARSQTVTRSLEDLRSRRKGIEDESVYLIEGVAMQQERLRLAQETFEAGRSLHEREMFSTFQLRQREEAVIAARQALSTLQRELQRNAEAKERLVSEEGKLAAQMAHGAAELALSRAQLDQRHAEHLADHGTVLVAGKAGRVVALQARPGSPVLPGRALAIIVPDGARVQAELWVPSRAAGFLEPGDQVRLMYDAYPYQKFGVGRGTIVSIAGAPTDPADLVVPIETKEALYRLIVNVEAGSVEGYGRRWQLTPGMRLSADLILDDRSLWEWLFDPIIAARRRAAN